MSRNGGRALLVKDNVNPYVSREPPYSFRRRLTLCLEVWKGQGEERGEE